MTSTRLFIEPESLGHDGLSCVEGENIQNLYRYHVPSLREWATEKDANLRNERHQEVHSIIAKLRNFGYNKIVTDSDYVVYDGQRNAKSGKSWARCFVAAGPRERIFFDPKTVNAAIVTCGELCPGINMIIRGITQALAHLYGVKTVYGVRGGFLGFKSRNFEERTGPIILRTEELRDIHHQGGSMLGTSKNRDENDVDLDEVLDWCQHFHVSQLYIVGGIRTHRVAVKLHAKCRKRKSFLSVVCIPKAINDDFGIIDRSFGHETAVEEACLAIASAKAEAACNKPNGIGIVHLMGKHAGFIAAHATLSSGDVDLCLLPEMPIEWDGQFGCLPHLKKITEKKGHAVIVVARGAGGPTMMEEISNEPKARASIHDKPKIGILLKSKIEAHFREQNSEATVKYIEPSYRIRSVPPNAFDSLYCLDLASCAVHGAMAGYTGFSVASVNNCMVYIPVSTLVRHSPQPVDSSGRTYERVLSLTGQPNTLRNPLKKYKEPKRGEKVPDYR